MSKKRTSRIAKTYDEYQDVVVENTFQELISTKPDELLFEIDRVGSKSARKKISRELLPQKEGTYQSKNEKKLVAKIISGSKRIQPNRNSNTNELKDLWDIQYEPVNNKSTQSKIGVKLPLPGQSYNPSVDDHQILLAEATKLESKHIKDLSSANNIMAMVQSHRQIDQDHAVEGDTDSIHPSDDDDDIQNPETDDVKVKLTRSEIRKKTKLTRAQRNKIKANKLKEFLENKKKKKDMVLKSINALPTILKELKKEEKITKEKKVLKEKVIPDEVVSLNYREVSLIPLSDELNGTLRQIIPKGSMIMNHMMEMREDGKLMDPLRRSRRVGEKPHGAEKIVWRVKYNE